MAITDAEKKEAEDLLNDLRRVADLYAGGGFPEGAAVLYCLIGSIYDGSTRELADLVRSHALNQHRLNSVRVEADHAVNDLLNKR